MVALKQRALACQAGLSTFFHNEVKSRAFRDWARREIVDAYTFFHRRVVRAAKLGIDVSKFDYNRGEFDNILRYVDNRKATISKIIASPPVHLTYAKIKSLFVGAEPKLENWVVRLTLLNEEYDRQFPRDYNRRTFLRESVDFANGNSSLSPASISLKYTNQTQTQSISALELKARYHTLNQTRYAEWLNGLDPATRQLALILYERLDDSNTYVDRITLKLPTTPEAPPCYTQYRHPFYIRPLLNGISVSVTPSLIFFHSNLLPLNFKLAIILTLCELCKNKNLTENVLDMVKLTNLNFNVRYVELTRYYTFNDYESLTLFLRSQADIPPTRSRFFISRGTYTLFGKNNTATVQVASYSPPSRIRAGRKPVDSPLFPFLYMPLAKLELRLNPERLWQQGRLAYATLAYLQSAKGLGELESLWEAPRRIKPGSSLRLPLIPDQITRLRGYQRRCNGPKLPFMVCEALIRNEDVINYCLSKRTVYQRYAKNGKPPSSYERTKLKEKKVIAISRELSYLIKKFSFIQPQNRLIERCGAQRLF